LDAYAAFDIPMTDRIALQIGGEMRYYGLDTSPGSYASVADPDANINPIPPPTPENMDPNADGLSHGVAAGVTDLYVGAFVSGTYTLPGVAR
jgi:hypothetical protein